MKKLLLCGILLWGGLVSAALVEKTVEVTTKQKNSSIARRELMEAAQNRAIEEQVRETIGDERFAKNKSVIQTKVLKMSSRLIPFAKAGDLVPEGDGFKLKVLLRINSEELDALLVQNGLFYEADVQPILLPMVAWIDGIDSEKSSWWVGSGTPFLNQANLELETALRNQFLKDGFFVLRPQAFSGKESSTVSSTQPSINEIQTLATSKGAQVVIQGEVKLSPNPSRSGAYLIDVKISTLHVPRNRNLAQVVRRFETEPGTKVSVISPKLKGIFETVGADLSSQTLEAWQKGSAQSNFYKITINGGLNPAQQEAFREVFKSTIREVKTIRERWISAQSVIFEIDSVVAPKEIAKRASELSLGTGKLILKDASEKELRYQLM
jgi:hypothetical protein